MDRNNGNVVIVVVQVNNKNVVVVVVQVNNRNVVVVVVVMVVVVERKQ